MIELVDLWKVSEYDTSFEVNSSLGKFGIVLDMYGGVFIQIKNNDKLFKKIHFLLNKNENFIEI